METKLSRLCYGSGKMDDPSNPHHVKMFRQVWELGLSVHSCSFYSGGAVFEVLRKAIKESPSARTPLILKVDGKSPELLETTVKHCLRLLNIDCIDVAQVCGNPDIHLIRPGGAVTEMMRRLKKEGLVKDYCLEIFHDFSTNLLPAIEEDLFEQVIFYFNASERQANDALYRTLKTKKTPIIALRTLGGGWAQAGENQLLKTTLEKAIEDTTCSGFAEFQARFANSFSQIKTTISGSTNFEHVKQMHHYLETAPPLPSHWLSKIESLLCDTKYTE